MHKALLTAKNVIVQGITGSHGAFHTAAMQAAGTHIIAGTSPNKAGQTVDGVPVYASIADIQKSHQKIDTSIIFVPAPFAKNAMIEAIEASIPLIICITEGVPMHDMLIVKRLANERDVTIVGPNCPGVLIPGVNKLGIIPAAIGLAGHAAIVSRSGTLTYEVAAGLTARGVGQKYIIGIGGDRIRGVGFIDCLKLFEEDSNVTSIVLIGEIGSTDEQRAAQYIKTNITKPVWAYIAGHHAPMGVQLGHAGAIFGSKQESAKAKSDALLEAGVQVLDTVADLIQSVK